MPRIPFNGPTNTGKSRVADYQRTVNWYPELSQTAKGQVVLYPTPGLTVFTESGDGPIRGAIATDTFYFFVSGTEVYRFSTATGSTKIGDVASLSGRVAMAHNGNEVLIVDGLKGYHYNISTATYTSDISAVDSDFPNGAAVCDTMDGYFIVNDPANVGRFYVSALRDGLNWSALDFATAERSPDALVSLVVNGRELWLLGSETAEVWYNSGNELFPFEPIQSAFSEWGCAAAFSVANADSNVFWLAKNTLGQGLVVMTTGYQATIVSTDAISDQISSLNKIDDAFGFCYQYQRHIFYVLTFPTDRRTFVYDISTQMWHEWSSFETEGRHDSNTHDFFEGYHLVGDAVDGKIYRLDWNRYNENGNPITRLRRSPHIYADNKYVFHRNLEVEFEGGVGAELGVDDPQVMLRWSDDGGNTWSNEYFRSLGQEGQFKNFAEWRRLGRSKDRVYEIKVTDDVKAVMINGWVDINATDRNE